MKKFFIALSSIVVVLFVAVVGAHFYGLQNLNAYQLDRFTTEKLLNIRSPLKEESI